MKEQKGRSVPVFLAGFSVCPEVWKVRMAIFLSCPKDRPRARSSKKDLWLSYFPLPDQVGEASAGDGSTDASRKESVAAFGVGNV